MLLAINGNKIAAIVDADGVNNIVCDVLIPQPEDFDAVYMDEYVYENGQLTLPIEGINRDKRNSLLTECDWTQIADVPLTAECKAAFATYRQALRDVDLLNPVWPEKPAEEWVA